MIRSCQIIFLRITFLAPAAWAKSSLLSIADPVARRADARAMFIVILPTDTREKTVNISASALTSPPKIDEKSTPSSPKLNVIYVVAISIATKTRRALRAIE